MSEGNGDALADLQWIQSPPLNLWNQQRLKRAQKLIYDTTGEMYDTKRLRKLPLDERFGAWVLSEGNRDYGVLWGMLLDQYTARVLAFSISKKVQGKGLGRIGWSTFAAAAKGCGIQRVQLEVRQDNASAIQLYHRRGLRPRGYITGFYRGHDGWLMMGPLQIQPSSQ